jgi:hypothetical protein
MRVGDPGKRAAQEDLDPMWGSASKRARQVETLMDLDDEPATCSICGFQPDLPSRLDANTRSLLRSTVSGSVSASGAWDIADLRIKLPRSTVKATADAVARISAALGSDPNTLRDILCPGHVWV